MIAKLKFRDGRTAELQDNLTWACADRLTLRRLQVLYDPLRFGGPSPADGTPGFKQAAQAAKDMGADVEFAVYAAAEEGTIY